MDEPRRDFPSAREWAALAACVVPATVVSALLPSSPLWRLGLLSGYVTGCVVVRWLWSRRSDGGVRSGAS